MSMAEEITARLRATFIAELADQIRAMNAALLALESSPQDAELIRSLFRGAHTIKGAASVAGFPQIERLCHALESLFARARDEGAALQPGEFQLGFEALDMLSLARDSLQEGGQPDDVRLAAMADRVATPTAAASPQPLSPPESVPRKVNEAQLTAITPPPVAPAAADPEETVRVRSDRVDTLVALAGELMAASAAATAQPREWIEFRDALVRWASRMRSWSRRDGSIRPGGNGRDAAGSLNTELTELLRRADQLARTAAMRSATLERAVADITAAARELRLRRFGDVVEVLPRTVRDVAARTGKRMRLEIEGTEVAADRVVIDALREPLVHLIRNAADHGIEQPSDRVSAGKPEEGTIRVAASLARGRLRVVVEDDGAGINAEAVRAKMRERGLSAPVDDRQLARALFAGGISTRREATDLSGRGVGLDVVRSALESLGGHVRVSWKPAEGSRFVLDAPPTPAVLGTLVVEAGGQLFALPTSHIEGVVRLKSEWLRRMQGRLVLARGGAPVPLASLSSTLGSPLRQGSHAAGTPVVLLHSGDERAALAVDALMDAAEIVVRPLPRDAAVPHVTGGALLASGRIALVLNADTLVDAAQQAGDNSSWLAREQTRVRHRVIIADDSITTRTLEQSVLEAAGFEVTTAVDGADAWEKLQAKGADLLIADVEMPQLTGFELCERARASKRFAELPIVLVTALESAEDRARGLDAGADAYITKSSFDQTALLDVIRQLLG